jgi:predicted dehydrogenase
MANRIRLGFVGANVNSTWAGESHFPALLAHPDFEWTAVCTTKPESAEEARKKFGAKLAFHDYREMVKLKEIDAVAVVVRVPEHYGPTMAAIEAGKHVYTEWPLGRTTAEAEEMAQLALAKNVRTACGLQSHVSPALCYMKELVENDYVGEVLSMSATGMRDGPLERMSSRTWNRDVNLGATAFTIANGHVMSAIRFVLGDFSRVSCILSTHNRQWLEKNTKKWVDVTSPDNIRTIGQLKRGAGVAVHVGAVPWAGSGFRMEVYGKKGTLVANGDISSQRGQMLRVQGTQGDHDLKDLAIPDRYNYVPVDFPRGDSFNVGQMYTLFAEAIRTGKSRMPTFDTAVEHHRFLDICRQSSELHRELLVK